MRRSWAVGALLVAVAVWAWAEGIPGTRAVINTPAAVCQALERAYPGWVVARNPLEGPAVAVNGQTFVWAEGRLLAPEDRNRWADFAPQPFYEYPVNEPSVETWSAEELARAEERLADRRASVVNRSPGFFDALWGISDRKSADEHQARTRFLGLPLTVHRTLVPRLARIEARLQQVRKGIPELDQFLKGLDRLEGYNWRPIAETQSRSNHSYGTAIDLVPRSFGSKNPYWLWANDKVSPGWYRTAWVRRWKPHPAVVQAFEDEGFVWGGKWLLFDTIHFEYRPEILVLNGLR